MRLYKTIPISATLISAVTVLALCLPMHIFAQAQQPDSNTLFSGSLHSDTVKSSQHNKPLTGSFTRLFLNEPLVGLANFQNLSGTSPSFPFAGSSYNSLLKDLQHDLKEKINSPVLINNASISFAGKSGDYNTDSLFNINNYNLGEANLTASLTGIPLTVSYQSNYYPGLINNVSNRITVKYDRQAYIDIIKNRLKGKFNPEDFLHAMKDPIESLKATSLRSLNNELDNLQKKYSGLLTDKLSQLGLLSDLFLKDPNTIRKKLLSNEWLGQLQAKTEQLAQLQIRINTGQAVDMQEYSRIKAEMEKYKGTKELITVLETHSRRWNESGLIKKICEGMGLKKEMLQQIINDPRVISKMAKQKLDLNGLQRLFLSVTKLNSGQIVADLSRHLTGNTLMNGISSGFLLNKNKSIDILAGGQRTINSLLDMRFSNGIYHSDNNMLGIRLNNSGSQNANSSISLLAFQTAQTAQMPLAGYALPRRSMIVGISRHIEVTKANVVDIELSKSSGNFRNELKADSTNNGHLVNDLLNTEDILKSLAVSLNYAGHFDKINLQAETFLHYTGINYDNPATTAGGTREAGLYLRKSFLKNKLQVSGRTYWRHYKFSEYTGNQWRNSNYLFDVKWKVKKNQSISLRYQPARSSRLAGGIRTAIGNTERLAANFTLTAKIKSVQSHNYFTLAFLKNYYLQQNGSEMLNRSFQLTLLQNYIVGKHVFYSNTVFNKVNDPSAFIFFNTSFNSDWGVTYNIGQKLSASSGLNYNSITGWYRQIAIKQSLSGQLGKKIKLDLYMDIGKNLKLIQQLPYGLCRAEWSFQYLFNR